MRFVSPFGFSNGIDELTLKKPPPLVPSSLIASCEATGPRGAGPRDRAAERLQDALRDEHERADERDRQQHVEASPG